jgi:hypothetical protein
MYKSQGTFSHFGTKFEVHIRIVHDTAWQSTQEVFGLIYSASIMMLPSDHICCWPWGNTLGLDAMTRLTK